MRLQCINILMAFMKLKEENSAVYPIGLQTNPDCGFIMVFIQMMPNHLVMSSMNESFPKKSLKHVIFMIKGSKMNYLI